MRHRRVHESEKIRRLVSRMRKARIYTLACQAIFAHMILFQHVTRHG